MSVAGIGSTMSVAGIGSAMSVAVCNGSNVSTLVPFPP